MSCRPRRSVVSCRVVSGRVTGGGDRHDTARPPSPGDPAQCAKSANCNPTVNCVGLSDTVIDGGWPLTLALVPVTKRGEPCSFIQSVTKRQQKDSGGNVMVRETQYSLLAADLELLPFRMLVSTQYTFTRPDIYNLHIH